MEGLSRGSHSAPASGSPESVACSLDLSRCIGGPSDEVSDDGSSLARWPSGASSRSEPGREAETDLDGADVSEAELRSFFDPSDACA